MGDGKSGEGKGGDAEKTVAKYNLVVDPEFKHDHGLAIVTDDILKQERQRICDLLRKKEKEHCCDYWKMYEIISLIENL